ncbi:MAG TPA: isochorismatase family protein [Caulobacteraceae bacterium]|nr:isochorismatase family protein [Caulobacteraceae bacterium]
MSLVHHEQRCSSSTAPWLICLDLQREFVVPGRPHYDPSADQVAGACARVIDHARAARWRIVHSQRRRLGGLFCGETLFGAPIEGLRPLISEPVFLRTGLSAFSSPEFASRVEDARNCEVCLIGFSVADSCLATAFSAIDAGLSLTVVEDAIGGDAPGAAAEVARSILGRLVRLISVPEFISEARGWVEYAS